MSAGYIGQYQAHVPVLDPHGFQVDTPEVAHAKAAHFAAHAEVAGRSGYGHYSAPAVHAAPAVYADHHHAGYIPSFDHNGYQLDTPEVAHAKAAHLAELAKANANEHHAAPYVAAPYSHSAPYGYSAPYTHAATSYGYPAVAHNGAPLDTPEVAQAKAAHAAAHAEAHARSHHY